MKKYYETLEISQGASPSEIKKAYFKMVRMYSPEKNPEKFREIREAYEFLKNAEESGPSFPSLKEHGAELFLKQIQEYERRRNFVMFRNACEEAVRLFPEEMQFQYLLAVAQRKAGNTGKAVKSGEMLVKKDPENKWYWRELTMDYIERGFSRKAFPCIIRAFEMGCNDNDFLLTASVECRELGQIEESMKLLWALVRKDKRWKREEIPDVLEAYSGLCIIGKDMEEVQREILSALLEFLNEYPMYLEENIEILSLIVAVMVNISIDNEYNENLNKIIQTIRDTCHSEKFEQLLSENIKNRNVHRLCNDERFGDTIKSGVLLYYDEELDNELRTFFSLDSKLCMLKEQNEILSQLEILEKEYPIFYEQIQDFAKKLKSGKNLHYIKDSMQHQYAALTKYIDGGRYFELYPEEKTRSFGKVFYENDDFQPYVRTEKKIGRNDACPCGSGKKYKHCCMRKS